MVHNDCDELCHTKNDLAALCGDSERHVRTASFFPLPLPLPWPLGLWVFGPLGLWAFGPLGLWAFGPLGLWAFWPFGLRLLVPAPFERELNSQRTIELLQSGQKIGTIYQGVSKGGGGEREKTQRREKNKRGRPKRGEN